MRLSRRRLVSGLVALPYLARPASAAMVDCDVAIIGAGSAGIGAARALKAAGVTYRVLEARDRPGGRVFTDTSLGQPFDAGAAFIHWNDRNPWRTLAEELGVPTIEEPSSASFLAFADGQPVPRGQGTGRRRAFQVLEEKLDNFAADAPDVSLAALVGADGPDLLRAAGSLARMNIGDEPDRISVRDWANLWEGDDLVVPSGYGTLVARAAEGLAIDYRAPVSSIAWDGPIVAIESAKGSLRARKVIVTTSIGVLAGGAIRFSPGLPDAVLKAIDGLEMGALIKIALRFDGNKLGLPVSTDMFDSSERGANMMAEAWGFGRDLVVVMVGGDYARSLEHEGERGAVDAVLTRLAGMIGADVRKHFVAGRLAAWSTDPFARGCYTHAKVGRAAARAELEPPVADRIWFAGEANAGGGSVTAGGALLAGRRAAEQALRSIRA